MQDGPFPTFPSYNRQSSRKARAFLLVGLFIGLIAATMVAGNYFLSSSRGEEEQKIVVANTPAPSPTATSSSPSLTPTPTKAPLDKKELSIQALNGSGTKGAASDLSAVLKEAGYTVAATGNAEEFDYQETVIQLKKSKQEYKDVLIADLEKEYPVSDTVETLAENARFDAIVVVGAK